MRSDTSLNARRCHVSTVSVLLPMNCISEAALPVSLLQGKEYTAHVPSTAVTMYGNIIRFS